MQSLWGNNSNYNSEDTIGDDYDGNIHEFAAAATTSHDIRSAHAYVAACRHALQLTRAFQRTFTKILQVIFARERSRGVPRAFEGDMCFYSCVIDFGSQLSG